MKVLAVIGAIALLPLLALAQQPQLPQPQLPQPRKPGKWCPEGWSANGNYCVPGSDKARPAIPRNGWCPVGWRESGSYCIRWGSAAAGILNGAPASRARLAAS